MMPEEPLRLLELPELYKGVFSNVYVCEDSAGRKFLFKEVKNHSVLFNELIAHRVAKVVGIPALDFLNRMVVEGKEGLVMTYVKGAPLLSGYGKALNKSQHRDLQRIVLFDLLIGNRDRHAANIMVGERLVAFDHGRAFVDRSAIGMKFVKLELGRLLDKRYVDKIEEISSGKAVSTRDALVHWFGFHAVDVDALERISESGLRYAIDSAECPGNVRDSAFEFVIFRKKMLAGMSYC
jgi:hypothetical protein